MRFPNTPEGRRKATVRQAVDRAANALQPVVWDSTRRAIVGAVLAELDAGGYLAPLEQHASADGGMSDLSPTEYAAGVVNTLSRLGYTEKQLAEWAAERDFPDAVAVIAWHLIGTPPSVPLPGEAEQRMAGFLGEVEVALDKKGATK